MKLSFQITAKLSNNQSDLSDGLYLSIAIKKQLWDRFGTLIRKKVGLKMRRQQRSKKCFVGLWLVSFYRSTLNNMKWSWMQRLISWREKPQIYLIVKKTAFMNALWSNLTFFPIKNRRRKVKFLRLRIQKITLIWNLR